MSWPVGRRGGIYPEGVTHSTLNCLLATGLCSLRKEEPLAAILQLTDTWYEPLLACPECVAPLSSSEAGWVCTSCGRSIDRGAKPPDLRPVAPPELRADLPRKPPDLSLLDRITLREPSTDEPPCQGSRDSRSLFAALQEARSQGGDLLDLGCGPRDQAEPAARSGFRYVGMDIEGSQPDLLGDAHALPFSSGAFDVVLSYAVAEHLHNPFIAFREVRRVLRPGGYFVGTVSQGEPFHASFFHMTPWGLQSVLASSGLRLERLWPSYDTLRGLARMGRYSRPTRLALGCLAWIDARTPFFAPRRWLRSNERETQLEALLRAASLCFLARSTTEAGAALDHSEERPAAPPGDSVRSS